MSDVGFVERVAALVGRTAYRQPVSGRATVPSITDQDVAAALAMGRLRNADGRPDWKDVGPEIAYGMACNVRCRKPDVCSLVMEAIAAEMLRLGGKRGIPKDTRRLRLGQCVNAAYEDLVMHIKCEKPKEIPERVWAFYYALAFSTMLNAAQSALYRAEKALYRECTTAE